MEVSKEIKSDRQRKKELLNLSGEFRVASELIRRGIFCSVTYGNSKGTDLIIFDPKTKKALIVEVKTTSEATFLTGFYKRYKTELQDAPDFWVLYYQHKTDSTKDEFFILTHKELSEEQAKRNKSVELSWQERAIKHANGVDNVVRKDLEKYFNKWDQIKKRVSYKEL